jgi:hypothetical protein
MERYGAVMHAVGNLGGAEAAGGSRHVDGFEEARLAGAITPEEKVGPALGLPGEGL